MVIHSSRIHDVLFRMSQLSIGSSLTQNVLQ